MVKQQKTYWTHNGKHQAEFNRLYKKLIPKSGKAVTICGELLRCMSNCYHDLWNNGFCNLDTDHRWYEIQFIRQRRDEIIAQMRDKNVFPRVERILCTMRERCVAPLPQDDGEDDEQSGYEILIDDKFRADFEKVADAIIVLVKKLDKKEKAYA